MPHTLIIVPCGQGKIWDQYPHYGPVPARDAYTGAPFKVNRAFAERFADDWMILSAKYGFVTPEFLIPGPYNVTFKRKSTEPVSARTLQDQVKRQNLGRYNSVIGLGGKEYRAMIEAAFASLPIELRFPFAGLPIGKMMQATKRAIETGKV
jgi:hypothetical protein